MITLKVERGTSGAVFVTSPEVKGLNAVGMTLEKALAEVPDAIRQLSAAAPAA